MINSLSVSLSLSLSLSHLQHPLFFLVLNKYRFTLIAKRVTCVMVKVMEYFQYENRWYIQKDKNYN
jgi:hypothetical protein